ncbi:transglutaminase domain-containing protein [Reichenbachiella ulvae]|uniref:Transglutaminase-like domain-containing protein n=1 Tax=Reichenbachiella ulvae TaxID=2980104 RepID=A0ABT3CQI3_9BACT|nr:transglutaminase domain-containing protein [Reichenbachiella ulvae]MCV9385917.1 hypothetical protein [Reichenbachiella ulvae]
MVKGLPLWIMICVLGYSTFLPQFSLAQSTDYSKADSLALALHGHSIQNLKLLADHLTIGLSTDQEKFRAIFRWVCDNISNDYSLYARNKRMREKYAGDTVALIEWNKKFKPKVIQSLVKKRSTVCTGYAYLIKELAYHAGIRCEIIDGYGRSAAANIGGSGYVNHSWNAVLLDGEWFLCDATWSSGQVNDNTKGFQKNFTEAYFLTKSEIFNQNHYPLDPMWLLVDEPKSLDYFLNAPLLYYSAIAYGVEPQMPQVFDLNIKKEESLTIIFSALEKLGNEKLKLDILSYSGKFIQSFSEFELDEDGLYESKCPLSKGKYIIHLKHGNEFLMTYQLTVD